MVSVLFFTACTFKTHEPLLKSPNDSLLNVQITKWYGDNRGALSITNDNGSPNGEQEKKIQLFLLSQGMTLDYELVTANYLLDSSKQLYLKQILLPLGFGFFGHGHYHFNHDDMTYEEALESFSMCYNIMKSFGVNPVAYAYPGGHGYLFRTRRALRDAGFLCGRKYEELDHYNPYIIPYDVDEPDDWFGLPSLVMQAYDYGACDICINNTDELIPFLDETLNRSAWLILTYHAIGSPSGYGYYYFDDFKTDVFAIKSRNFWTTSMGNATLYIRERKQASATAILTVDENKNPLKIKLSIIDGLDNSVYNQPLTLKIGLPDVWWDQSFALIYDNSPVDTVTADSTSVLASLLPNGNYYYLLPHTD